MPEALLEHPSSTSRTDKEPQDGMSPGGVDQSLDHPGLHAPHHGGPAIIFICLGCAWLGTVIAVALSPALPAIAQVFGRGTDGAGLAQLLQTLPAVTMIIGALTSGYLSERLGRRIILITALTIYAVSGAAGLFAGSLPLLVGCRLLLGLAGGAMLTVSYATIGEYFEGAARERMLGFGSTFGSLSSVFHLLVAGMLVDHFGWRAPFWLYLPALAIVPFAWFGMHRGRTAGASTPLSWRPVVALWPVFLLLTAYTIGMYMSVIQTPFLVVAHGLGSATMIGFILATTSVMAAICAAFYGFLRPLLGFNGIFLLISAALGGGMLICVAAPNLPLFLVGAALLGLGTGLIEPACASRALAKTQEALHDRAMGAIIMALFLGQFLNPVVLAPLRQSGGIGFAFVVAGGAYLCGAILFGSAILRKLTTKSTSG